ncbi:TonB-dependent receptor [Massilia sp. PDC64]|nr:TonB-dependent receptor [Massilia sp. PDC64]SDD67146.1 TonB-dependent receptor [Massilia sp. PDC64]
MHQPGKVRPQQRILSITPIAAACAALLWGGAAGAQDTGDATASTVIVTGIRGSIESSMAIKRDSDSIVEAVTAEDIGKLPDVSIAESIARLPGLTAQRVAGRAQVISLRGLSPDFAGTLMNGRELVSTSNNRGAEYDQYPSELINGVTVYKTPDASLVGQGLSGTVDLQTVRPLDRRERAIAFNVRGERNGNGKLNDESSAWGQRVSAAYIDQFMNNTVGVAIGFAHLNSPGQQKEYKAWWWGDQNNLPPGNADVVALKGAEVTATSRKQVRDGLMAVLDYKPSREFRSTVDLYYSQFDQTEIMRGMMWNSHQWSAVTYRDPQIETIGNVKLLTGGTLVNLEPIARNDYNTRKDTLGALGWNNKYRTGEWEFIGDLSYSQARRHEQVLETYAGLGPAGSGITDNNFQFRIPVEDGIPKFTPSVDFTNPAIIKLTDVGGWGKDADMHRPKVDDTLGSLKVSAKRSLTAMFSYVEGGLNYSKRDKKHSDINNYYFLKNNHAPVSVSPDLVKPSTSLSFAGIPAVLTYDTLGVLAKYYDQQPARSADLAIQNWSVEEKVTTGYAKLGIDTDLGPVPVRGNLGVQVIGVKQGSDGLAVAGDKITPLHGGSDYTDVLPSLNLNFDLGHFVDRTALRFGAAKTVARPQMQDMRAGASGGISDTTREWSGSGGNPTLEPWRARAFDLSLENYFAKSSYVAVAAFYKNLTNYIYNQQTAYDFTGFPTQSKTVPISNIGTMNRPANGQGGMVKGLELSGSLEGGLLWRALDGFGIVGSYSLTASSIHPNGPGTSEKLPGLSGSVSNVTLFYEKNGFSARVSQRYRSAFRGEVTGLFALRSFSEILAEKQIDFQTGYAFEQGSLKGLSILLQVNNLNNSPYQTKQGSPFASGAYAPERYTTYGRQVLLGLNYRL